MKTSGKIALAGGGRAEDSRRLDEVFASWLNPGGKLLYLPIALRGLRPFEACFDWIKSVFLPLNITNITMWTDLFEHKAGELDKFEGIYIGGGNTYSLLDQVKKVISITRSSHFSPKEKSCMVAAQGLCYSAEIFKRSATLTATTLG